MWNIMICDAKISNAMVRIPIFCFNNQLKFSYGANSKLFYGILNTKFGCAVVEKAIREYNVLMNKISLKIDISLRVGLF